MLSIVRVLSNFNLKLSVEQTSKGKGWAIKRQRKTTKRSKLQFHTRVTDRMWLRVRCNNGEMRPIVTLALRSWRGSSRRVWNVPILPYSTRPKGWPLRITLRRFERMVISEPIKICPWIFLAEWSSDNLVVDKISKAYLNWFWSYHPFKPPQSYS